MASFKSTFSKIVLLFVLFTTLPIADLTPDKAMKSCINDVKFLCLTKSAHPDAKVCIFEAFESWDDTKDLDPIMQTYYLSFLDNVDIGAMKTPEKYCDVFGKKEIVQRCKHQLEVFGGTHKDAINHGLYKTMRKLHAPVGNVNLEDEHFVYLYMTHMMTQVKAGSVKPPWTHCKESCYPQLKGDIDWSPYIESTSVHDDFYSEIRYNLS